TNGMTITSSCPYNNTSGRPSPAAARPASVRGGATEAVRERRHRAARPGEATARSAPVIRGRYMVRSTRVKRRKAGMVIGAATLAAALLFAAIAAAGSRSEQRSAHAKKKDHYTFVVSNNFLGNDYRPQLLRLAKLTATLAPFKGRVTVKVV